MIHGIINIYKEPGFTSHDVVAKLRGILKQKKIGHTGTLDPAAEGVLPVCLGKGTKLCDMLTDKRKTYRAVLLLGVETDTQDTTGTVLAESVTENLTQETVRAAAESFIGPYAQIPPMYSALKVNGKKLYELAREGKEIERKARPVEIYDLQIEQIELPRVTMTVECSKGTYIRTLCYDIGRKLGCGGCMEKLIRTRVERFPIEESLRLPEVEQLVREGRLGEKVVSVDAMFEVCPEFCSNTAELDKLLRNGNPFPIDFCPLPGTRGEMGGEPDGKADGAPGGEPGEAAGGDAHGAEGGREGGLEWLRVYDSSRTFIGIYEYQTEERKWKPKKIFLGGD